MAIQTLSKPERLCSKRLLNLLFTHGKRQHKYPLLVTVCPAPESLPAPIQVVFVATKRKFPLSVDRHRHKRRLREAYRLEKNRFYEILANSSQSFLIGLTYIAEAETDFEQLRKQLRLAIEQQLYHYLNQSNT